MSWLPVKRHSIEAQGPLLCLDLDGTWLPESAVGRVVQRKPRRSCSRVGALVPGNVNEAARTFTLRG